MCLILADEIKGKRLDFQMIMRKEVNMSNEGCQVSDTKVSQNKLLYRRLPIEMNFSDLKHHQIKHFSYFIHNFPNADA